MMVKMHTNVIPTNLSAKFLIYSATILSIVLCIPVVTHSGIQLNALSFISYERQTCI